VSVRWTEEDATPVGEVEMIAVAPAHQRAGIGGRLLEQAVTGIRSRGVPLAVIGTGGDDGHAPARSLYERHGFTGLPLVRYYRAL
jgi:ribosomal protein S18 acetylase RimI-like enzyme